MELSFAPSDDRVARSYNLIAKLDSPPSRLVACARPGGPQRNAQTELAV